LFVNILNYKYKQRYVFCQFSVKKYI
jgi:hypothetical protein